MSRRAGGGLVVLLACCAALLPLVAGMSSAFLIIQSHGGTSWWRVALLNTCLTAIATVLLITVGRMATNRGAAEERRHRPSEPAGIDLLTQVYNRRFLQIRLDEEVAVAHRYGRALSLLFVDVDQFREVNAKAGHDAGDQVLARVGKAIRNAVRVADVVARWDGDEFAVLAPETAAGDALVVAKRIQAQVAYELGGQSPYPLTVSIGLADLPGCADDAASLLSAAESALALVQRRGPNAVLYFKDLGAADLGPDDALVLTQRLKNLTMGTIRALATAVDKRDHYTHGHGRAMQQMLALTAERLGLDAQTRAALLAGAELHDVGKIGVPDHILRKPGKLTPEEYDLMKRHPEAGKDIVAAAPELNEVVPAILYHHEHWDGSGYPFGLKGTEIPLVARLIAIADAYHAMTSDRPYRLALGHSAAVAELQHNAGTQFDPDLVTVFLACLEPGLAEAA